MVSQQHARPFPSVVTHFVVCSDPGTNVQDSGDPILIAEVPLHNTLDLEEFKDLIEKRIQPTLNFHTKSSTTIDFPFLSQSFSFFGSYARF